MVLWTDGNEDGRSSSGFDFEDDQLSRDGDATSYALFLYRNTHMRTQASG